MSVFDFWFKKWSEVVPNDVLSTPSVPNLIISPKGNEREEASSSQESNPQKEGSIATVNQIINDLEKLKLSL